MVYTVLAFGELTYSNHLPEGYEIEAKEHQNGRDQVVNFWNFQVTGLFLE